MLAYHKTDFDQFLLSRDQGFDQASPFYSPNFFARIGLFLFGNLGGWSVFGLFSLVFMSGGRHGLGFLLTLFALGLVFLLEAMLRREKPFFRAGLEEAALYGALGCLISALFWSFGLYIRTPIGFYLFVAILFSLAAIRYADSLLAVVAYGLGLYVVFTLVARGGNSARYLLPPLVMVISAGMIWASGKALRHSGWRYWHHLGKALRCVSIVTCYAGGNYFVVRELSRVMFGLSLGPEEDIPLAFVFNAFTFGFPIFCIAWGLRQHDRIFLQVGLALVGFAVFTYKYYHSTLPLEVGMVLGGVVLLGLAAVAIKVFRNTRYGITSQSHASYRPKGAQNLEGLAALANVSGQEVAPQNSGGDGLSGEGLQGGGGKFGGGGASSGF